MRNKLIALFALLLCVVGCKEPSAGETFLAAPRNSYDFSVEVRDSLASYDFSFFTRVDGGNLNTLAAYAPLRLDIAWVSPSDSTYRETVYMDGGSERGIEQKYRTGMVFPQSGTWTLKVAVSEESDGFRGLGLIWKKDGTR